MSSDDLLRDKAEFEHTLDSCLSASKSCDNHMINTHHLIIMSSSLSVFLEFMVNIY